MKKLLKLVLLALLIMPSLSFCDDIKPVKYVFLFIGDGMSIPQRILAEEYSMRTRGCGLAINAMPNKALTTTRSVNYFITDSAAAGTAIACGTKTLKGAIGVDKDGNKLESIASVAKKNGKKVGIITSVTLNHATPAAFYGHNATRNNYYALGLDLIESNFDFFGGGEIDAYDGKSLSSKYYKQSRELPKEFKGNLYKLAEEKSYKIVRGKEALEALKKSDAKIIAPNSKNYDGALEYEIDDANSIKIGDYTKKAIELLDNDKGFFIMVEGGKIDWQCHNNDAATVVKEVFDFDNAVKLALDFAKQHPDETLIVVTGDHETGGLSLGFANTEYDSLYERLAAQKKSGQYFHDCFIEILDKKGNDLEFEDVQDLIETTFGIKFKGDKKDPFVLKEESKGNLKKAFERSKKYKSKALSVACTRELNKIAGLGWTSSAHTALPVETTATGVNAQKFTGSIDNTDIAKILKETVK